MLDRDRILGKLAELDSYLREIAEIKPSTLTEYQTIEKKRSCERLLQLSIECTIDVCKLFVVGHRLGLPSDETDLFSKIHRKGIITAELEEKLREMRGLRNILVHEYGAIDDNIVFRALISRLADFGLFKKQMIQALQGAMEARGSGE